MVLQSMKLQDRVENKIRLLPVPLANDPHVSTIMGMALILQFYTGVSLLHFCTEHSSIHLLHASPV